MEIHPDVARLIAASVPALSIRQPWAWAIIHAGKDVENREWNRAPSYRGPLLIHAAKTIEPDDWFYVERLSDTTPPYAATIERGGIIGVVDLVDAVWESDSPWYFGKLGLVLANPRPLPFTPCKGMLGLFSPSFPS